LSRGSFEVQTEQWQPMVGTPIEVPEPSTVNNNVLREAPARGTLGEVSAAVRAELSGEDEWNCEVFADMMRTGNAARYVVTNT
jgi:hypothetical protein